MPSYGLAEHSLAVTFCHQGLKVDSLDPGRLVRESRAVPIADRRAASVRLVSCGRPFPEHDVKIVDEDGRQLPDRYVGRIVVRGPSVMAGYFEDPVATADTLRGGWLHTGDLGYLADGELFVCGRTKDLIIRQGRKYHPPDLESAIADLRGIRPAGVVVFGINRPDEADEVVAVLEARASMTPEDIIDHVRRRVRETAGLELDRVDHRAARHDSTHHEREGEARRDAGTLPSRHPVDRRRERQLMSLLDKLQSFAERIAACGDGPTPFDTVVDEVLGPTEVVIDGTSHVDVRLEQLFRL